MLIMFSKFEFLGAGLSIFFMGLALYFIQVDNTLFRATEEVQSAGVIQASESGIIVVGQSSDINQARAEAFLEAADELGNINRMVIDDVKIGAGASVKEGDTVSVHYVGTLQGGKEFDNSRKRGTPFEFKVGEGRVIKGWEEGLVGMKVGGERILVIPPDKAYGASGIGPIPANATLVFAIELLEIK